MKLMLLVPMLAAAASAVHSASAEEVGDTGAGAAAETVLERLARSLLNLTVFYHPPDPYSCYTTKSALYCTSKNYTLQVQSSISVQLLKQIIQHNLKYPVGLQVLRYQSQVLDNSQSLVYYDIRDHSLLDLTLSQIPKTSN